MHPLREWRAQRVAVAAVDAPARGSAAAGAERKSRRRRNYGQKADTLGTPEPEAEVEGPEPRPRLVHASASDITTAYFFRGILTGAQRLHLAAVRRDGDQPLQRATACSAASTSAWASGSASRPRRPAPPATGRRTSTRPTTTRASAHRCSNGLSTSLTYLLYTSPNGAFSTVQQLDLGSGLRRQRAARRRSPSARPRPSASRSTTRRSADKEGRLLRARRRTGRRAAAPRHRRRGLPADA